MSGPGSRLSTLNSSNKSRSWSSSDGPDRVIELLREKMWGRRHLAPIFLAYDNDHTGHMSYTDFCSALKALGAGRSAPKEVLLKVAQLADPEGTGTIDYNDFCALVEPASSCMEEGNFESELTKLLAVPHNAPRSMGHESPASHLSTTSSALRNAATENAMQSMASHEPSAEDIAAEAAAREAARFAREERRTVAQMQQLLSALRVKLTSSGSMASVFLALDSDRSGKISQSEFVGAMNKLGLNVSHEAVKRLAHELDLNGDGEVEFREFAQRVLEKLETAQTDQGKKASAPHATMRHTQSRHAAMMAAEQLREKLRQRYKSVADAYRQVDQDGDAMLSYGEFHDFVKLQLPDMTSLSIERLCHMLDADGDGSVDFKEFASLIEGASDDVDGKSASAITRRIERSQFEKAHSAVDGRFGSTPAFSYGTQARELLSAYPGCPGYAAADARFNNRPGLYGSGVKPPWQAADSQREKHRYTGRAELIRANRQREAAEAACRQKREESLAEARLESKYLQKMRYLQACAEESRRRYK